MVFGSILFLSQVASAEELVLQTEHAFAVHLSNTGLTTIGDAIKKKLPNAITIDAGNGAFDCSSTTQINYALQDWIINFAIDNIDFQTAEDQLQIEITGYISSGETLADLSGDCAVFEELSETCSLEIGTTPFSLTMDVEMGLENGAFVTNVAEPSFQIANITNPISDCLLSDAVDTLLGQDPALISNLIADMITGELDTIPQAVESGLDGAIDDLTISQRIDLLGDQLDINLEPTTVYVDENGLVFGFGSELSLDIQEACIDPTQFTPPEEVPWLTFDGKVFDSEMNYDAGLFLGRHFLEQIFYAVWASGVMCIDVSEQAGLNFTGDLAAGFFGEEVGELIGSENIEMKIIPSAPLSVMFSDDQPPISVVVDKLALVGFGAVEGRRTRLLQVDTSTEVGINIRLQENALLLEAPVDIERMTFDEAYHEILGTGYSEGVPGLFDLAIGSLLTADALPTINLPVILGMELDAIIWQPDQEQNWLGAHIMFTTENIEPYPLAGCSAADIGCGSSGPAIDVNIDDVLGCNDVQVGCEGGSCSHIGEKRGNGEKGKKGTKIRLPAGRMMGLFTFALVCLLRRRE